MPTEITLSWWQAGLSVVALLGLAWLSLRPQGTTETSDEPATDLADVAAPRGGDGGTDQLVFGLIGAFDLASGSDAVRAHVRQVLRGAGVDAVEVDPGADFDPATQEAVEAQPVTAEDEDDPGRPGTVVRVVRAGWRQGDRMLRPVEVVVWTR